MQMFCKCYSLYKENNQVYIIYLYFLIKMLITEPDQNSVY